MEDVIEYKRILRPVIRKDAKWFPIIHSIEITYNSQGILIIEDLQHGDNNGYLVSSDYIPNEYYTKSDIEKLFRHWNRWSDNDYRVGSSAQETFTRSWIKKNFGSNVSKSDIKRLCLCDELKEELKNKDYFYDKGIEYGKRNPNIEKIPICVIEFLFSLPNAIGDSWNDIRFDLCSEDIVSENDFDNLLFV